MQTTLIKKMHKAFSLVDKTWQQRKRKLTTASIFSDIVKASVNNRGFKHVLEAENSGYTAQALGLARSKLPEHCFAEINRQLQPVHGCARVYAIDGSKVHVHPTYAKDGCRPRTNDKPVSRPAVRPLMMLSSCFDVHTQTCYDAICSTHFNERTSAMEHFAKLNAGDTVLFDRGYHSRQLVDAANAKGVRLVVRLRKTAFKAASKFWCSSSTHQKVASVNDAGAISVVYLYKYFIDNKEYMCLTNFESTQSDVKRLYALRWKVETGFRRLKSNLRLEKAHSMCLRLFVQELEARILLDTVTMLSDEKAPKYDNQGSHKKPYRDPSYFQRLDDILEFVFFSKVASETCLNLLQTWRFFRRSKPVRHRFTPEVRTF